MKAHSCFLAPTNLVPQPITVAAGACWPAAPHGPCPRPTGSPCGSHWGQPGGGGNVWSGHFGAEGHQCHGRGHGCRGCVCVCVCVGWLRTATAAARPWRVTFRPEPVRRVVFADETTHYEAELFCGGRSHCAALQVHSGWNVWAAPEHRPTGCPACHPPVDVAIHPTRVQIGGQPLSGPLHLSPRMF